MQPQGEENENISFGIWLFVSHFPPFFYLIPRPSPVKRD